MKKPTIYRGSRKSNWHNPHKQAKLHLLRKSDVCALCGEKIQSMHDATIDHILPINKGGQDIPSNMQLAHNDCNHKKGNIRENS